MESSDKENVKVESMLTECRLSVFLKLIFSSSFPNVFIGKGLVQYDVNVLDLPFNHYYKAFGRDVFDGKRMFMT